MDEIQPRDTIKTSNADSFIDVFESAGDILKNASEFPRIPEETPASYIALIDYYLLGSGRSYNGLIRHYEKQSSPPTNSIATLRAWSHRYGWYERIADYEEKVASRQLAVLERARLEFIGKQVGMLFRLEEVIIKASENVDYDDVNLGQFARAIEKFSDTTQKVFDMQPTIRVTDEARDEMQPFRNLTAPQALNELEVFTQIIRDRDKLEDVVNEELDNAKELDVEN